VRYSLLLQKLGRADEARVAFREVVTKVDRASKVYFRAQKKWYQVTKANLQRSDSRVQVKPQGTSPGRVNPI